MNPSNSIPMHESLAVVNGDVNDRMGIRSLKKKRVFLVEEATFCEFLVL